MSIADIKLRDSTFIQVLFAIVLAWILVSLWLRALENFTFNTLKLDPESTFHALVIAVVVTILFIAFTLTVSDTVSNIIVGDTYSLDPDFPTSPLSRDPIPALSLFTQQ